MLIFPSQELTLAFTKQCDARISTFIISLMFIYNHCRPKSDWLYSFWFKIPMIFVPAWLKYRRLPRFTFSQFTRDPNLHNPHLHKTQIYTTPNLHQTQIYTTPDLHHLKFTKPRFTQTQIYKASILHKAQIYKIPNLHSPKITTPKSASN